ncbi:MAG: 2-C-methyl-D-erythritol 4-phosphate cytidylyltransferase [Acidobacteria bacterium ADurb.Bin051]|jgi:2-C-methyl-D-erythritol 4-phosphate cytidylyltransferase|nr:MAG: 2-C-methyl-D-erythritol 4-phosphate cytidylyltransferase [Acidobacteria bacterium ADurb.Bin051]HPA94920.1 2-C-methyl-D-erythritol 4-phosphate cytidylyltransferase [Thermoanaerobaculia bacterium]
MRPLLVLVPAGGAGERFGGTTPKQFLEIAGRPVLYWTLARLLSLAPERVIVALPPDRELPPAVWGLDATRIRQVAGGATRQASVAACLAAAADREPAGLVAVHDGARPATARADLLAVLAAAERTGAAVLGRRLTDTVKRLEAGRIVGTLDRTTLFRAETPQVFRHELLAAAFARAAAEGWEGTDEAALVERLGGVEIAAVEATRPNPKLTLPRDLPEVARLLAEEAA